LRIAAAANHLALLKMLSQHKMAICEVSLFVEAEGDRWGIWEENRFGWIGVYGCVYGMVSVL